MYIDPSEAEYPLSWNPLQDYRTLPRESALPLLSRLLCSLYKAPASPLIDAASELLFDAPQATVLTLYELVAETFMRDKFMPPASAERATFEALLKEHDATASAIKTHGRYLAKDTLVRNILGQEQSKFSLNALSEGAIVVLNVSRIRMFPTRITPLVRLFAHATRALSLAGNPSALYLYECVRTLTEGDAEHVFSERALLVTASDTLPLDEEREWRKRVLSRAGTVVAFTPNPNDVAFAEELFFPFVTGDELDKLEPSEFALMLSIDALRSRPFFARALPLPARSGISYQDVQVHARERYSTPRHIVDQGFQKKYAAPALPKKEDAPGFSNAFRSIFSKNAAGASGAGPARPLPPPPASPSIPKSPDSNVAAKADINKKPKEVSEDELRDMLQVEKPPEIN